MKYALYLWSAGKYRIYDAREFDSYRAVAQFYGPKKRKGNGVLTDLAAQGKQFKIKRCTDG